MPPTATRPSIDVPAARALLAANADTLVVDVRTPAEFETAHIDGAINLPLDQVYAHLNRIVADRGGRILLICQSDNGPTRPTASSPVPAAIIGRWSADQT
ncbi:rhodanese-like domain-containing protein [Solwaraspora sp. WMMD406]|uniref:rhodanese-like domain-containing protein n=1 Tax=Solwaraspora sp. WMMD406 TaxID=3016095 RepID=UPI002417E288|nr:rhodanese-like domain-containing protein [Solwaraspora sp. WMMD406]MDG4765602.1 rhodanese-like domain-containing protein [Solwaraspora sp. WMMD406]